MRFWILLFGAVGLIGCGDGEIGDDCEENDDCEDGLVCVVADGAEEGVCDEDVADTDDTDAAG